MANKGIVAKPTNSVVMMILNLLTRFSDISGNLFLLNGIAKNTGSDMGRILPKNKIGGWNYQNSTEDVLDYL